MARSPRSRLERVVEVATELAVVAAAIEKLRKGSNGAAIGTIATVLEREARLAAAALIRKRRGAKRQTRTATGQFR